MNCRALRFRLRRALAERGRLTLARAVRPLQRQDQLVDLALQLLHPTLQHRHAAAQPLAPRVARHTKIVDQALPIGAHRPGLRPPRRPRPSDAPPTKPSRPVCPALGYTSLSPRPNLTAARTPSGTLAQGLAGESKCTVS